MPRNFYPGKTESELLAIREQIMAARISGGQKMVGIEAGVRHEFEPLSQDELDRRLNEVDYALFVLDSANYENPYNRAGITRANFSR